MRVEHHPLAGTSLGTQRTVTALHFGDEQAARKIYIQASLHADELPGALTAYHLRHKLLELEAAGQIRSHIILVPMSNPIGLGQNLHYSSSGRFDLFSGQNFNRLGDLSLYGLTSTQLKLNQTQLGDDASSNVRIIRQAMSQALSQVQAKTQVEHLHLILLKMAHDADVVLDLHCDESAILHVYTLPQLWPTLEPLARFLGSQCQLLAEDSQANPFDEALSTVWARLQADYPQANIPCACASTTVELRSRADLSHVLSKQDAEGIVQYLAHQGDIALSHEQTLPLPELLTPAHPLSGKEYVFAPQSGVVVFHVKAGEWVTAGQVLADVVDPISDTLIQVHSPIAGIVYAHSSVQFAQQGDNLYSISGAVDLGKGAGLSA
ncbi:M14 family metallopeptidase [Hydromonas duriensis]|uniref:Succinylglutamate desuccinylase/Aspartoacylase catalytic domain-containing protein n=1 Tax=Hydromonas duriensis TaxID=1527608 RepID=A0A4R6Y8K5_9BURK|nr:M14 family metallopeptidase [Hydromonas duriensis]TDR31711.1 hypothetical protein DFR44_10894 [Hydromonas duriensis]